MLPLNLFYFYLIVMEEISLCIVQTRSHFPRNETEKLPNIAILPLLLQSPRIRRQLNNLPRKEKQRSCWLLTTRLWLCVRFRFRFRFCQPGIWVKELHVVELPNLEEEGNKLGLYEIEFHRLAFFSPIQLMFFWDASKLWYLTSCLWRKWAEWTAREQCLFAGGEEEEEHTDVKG